MSNRIYCPEFFKVTFTINPIMDSSIVASKTLEPIIESWLKENCEQSFITDDMLAIIEFEDESDLIKFKLRFNDVIGAMQKDLTLNCTFEYDTHQDHINLIKAC